MRDDGLKTMVDVALVILIVAVAYPLLKELASSLGSAGPNSAAAAGNTIGKNVASSAVNSATSFVRGVNSGIDSIIPAPFGLSSDANTQNFWRMGVPTLPEVWASIKNWWTGNFGYVEPINAEVPIYLASGDPASLVDPATQNLMDYLRSGNAN